jgi:hypothetical protein
MPSTVNILSYEAFRQVAGAFLRSLWYTYCQPGFCSAMFLYSPRRTGFSAALFALVPGKGEIMSPLLSFLLGPLAGSRPQLLLEVSYGG